MAIDRRALLLALAFATVTYAQYNQGGDDDDDDDDDEYGRPDSLQDRRRFRSRMLMAHGIAMSLAFAFMMPFGSGLIRLLRFRGTAWIHGTWQILAYLVALVGFGIGLWFAYTGGYLQEAHPIIGIVVVAMLFLQPLGGFLAHLWFKRKQRRNFFGAIHRWNGRIFVTLGAINGGLGIRLAGNNRVWLIAYSIVTAFFLAFWYLVSLFDWFRNRRKSGKTLRTTSEPKTLSQRGSV